MDGVEVEAGGAVGGGGGGSGSSTGCSLGADCVCTVMGGMQGRKDARSQPDRSQWASVGRCSCVVAARGKQQELQRLCPANLGGQQRQQQLQKQQQEQWAALASSNCMQLDAQCWQRQFLTCLLHHGALPCCLPCLLQILAGAADREAILPYIKWFQTMIRWVRYSSSAKAVQRLYMISTSAVQRHRRQSNMQRQGPARTAAPAAARAPGARPHHLSLSRPALPLLPVSHPFLAIHFFRLRPAGGAPSL